MTRGAEPDPYAVLGVPRNASEREIREAYRALVARYHPDRHQDNPLKDLASEKLAEVNRAYATLSNASRRSAFDAAPRTGRAPPAPGVPPVNPFRFSKLAALLLVLPFLLRFAAPLGRLLELLVREVIEALALLRGTPVPAVAVLAAMLGLTFALLRRRRVKSKASAAGNPRQPRGHGQRS
jgi:curved DNA-binding protein CbpA